MKNKLLLIFVLSVFAGFYPVNSQNLSPYIKVGDSGKDVQQTADQVNSALKSNGFDILGSYHPEGKSSFMVIAYTRKDLQDAVLQKKDRGALAAVLKVGLKGNGNTTTISYLNPEYLFNAYLMNDYDKHKTALQKVSGDVKSALSPLGNVNKPFGGSLSVKKLRKYQYKMMMPYFTDPVELEEFDSFKEGVSIIEKNLSAKKGNTALVYKLKFPSKKIAVYGIALNDKNDGESFFLPIIGEDHLAAMPFEIILQGDTATILHGRYRIALHWPELSMSTFMKIMSTPGYVEDTFEDLCK
jgi:uncharacterized protein (DUF302 family)